MGEMLRKIIYEDEIRFAFPNNIRERAGDVAL
jgi:hypothetical protein